MSFIHLGVDNMESISPEKEGIGNGDHSYCVVQGRAQNPIGRRAKTIPTLPPALENDHSYVKGDPEDHSYVRIKKECGETREVSTRNS